MMIKATLTLLSILVLTTIAYAPRIASADIDLQLMCTWGDGNDAFVTSPPIGTTVNCTTVCDENPDETELNIDVMDPMNNSVPGFPFTEMDNEADFMFMVDKPGAWHVWVLCFEVERGEERELEEEIHAGFFVLPESPIGAIAIAGSSMAALGAFVGLRRYKTRAL